MRVVVSYRRGLVVAAALAEQVVDMVVTRARDVVGGGTCPVCAPSEGGV